MRPSKPGLADLRKLRQKATEAATVAPQDRKPPPSHTKKRGKKTGQQRAELRVHAPAPVCQPDAQVPDVEDTALFRRAVKFVQPIKDTRRAILPPIPKATKSILKQRRDSATGQDPVSLAVNVSDHYAAAALPHDDTSFIKMGAGPDLIKNLRRGKWAIGATLDLHGATLEEARMRLDQFLQSCMTHRIKCVRIVHGKGHGSKHGEPVLKETIRRWLAQLDIVLAYVECTEQDGGAGAVQVLLRD